MEIDKLVPLVCTEHIRTFLTSVIEFDQRMNFTNMIPNPSRGRPLVAQNRHMEIDHLRHMFGATCMSKHIPGGVREKD